MAGAVDREERVLRQALVDACRWLNGSGLSEGTSGNISLRHGEVMLIIRPACLMGSSGPRTWWR